MVRSTFVGLIAVLLVAKAVTAIRSVPLAWEERQEKIAAPPQSTKAYEIHTENGTVDFTGEDEASYKPELLAIKKAGASTPQRAQEALDAIEVVVEGKDTEKCRIDWRWAKPKQSDWSAVVDFKVHAPKSVDARIETQNGRVHVENLAGNLKIVTDNGQIDAETTGNALDVKTTNGQIKAGFAGQLLKLRSTNGQIAADLTRCGKIGGEISTVNGVIEIMVGSETSCELSATTENGQVRCQPDLKRAPWDKNITSNSRRPWSRHGVARGILGAGGEKLRLTCQNGGILIRD